MRIAIRVACIAPRRCCRQRTLSDESFEYNARQSTTNESINHRAVGYVGSWWRSYSSNVVRWLSGTENARTIAIDVVGIVGQLSSRTRLDDVVLGILLVPVLVAAGGDRIVALGRHSRRQVVVLALDHERALGALGGLGLDACVALVDAVGMRAIPLPRGISRRAREQARRVVRATRAQQLDAAHLQRLTLL